VDRIASINPNHYPMVLTGDFNMPADRDEFAPLKAKMKDARETAVTTDRHATYNGWGKAEETIDYIWYSGFSSCTKFEVITKPYLERTFVSDHYPIQATLIF
jgi:endonuclease/exonuclease/phosphatase family metal-dependent hydrolase